MAQTKRDGFFGHQPLGAAFAILDYSLGERV